MNKYLGSHSKMLLIPLLLLIGVGITLAPSFFSSLFNKEKLIIQPSPVIVQEIKQIAELITVIYYDEITLEGRKSRTVLFAEKNDVLILIGRGEIHVGFDLSKLTESDIAVGDSSLTIILPEPELLDTIINPSGFETFIEEGTWSFDEITQYKTKTKETLAERAIERGVLDQARKRGTAILEAFFRSVGFANVVVIVKQSSGKNR